MRTKKTKPMDKPNRNQKNKNIHSALDNYYMNHLEKLQQEKDNIHKKKHQLKKKQIELNNTKEKFTIQSEIEDLQNEIKYIESGNKMNDYIMKTCHIVNKYSELNDKIQICNESELAEIIDKKHKLVEQYCQIMNIQFECNSNIVYEVCNQCQSTDFETYEGHSVCVNCGLSNFTVETHNTLSFKEAQEHNYKPVFTYQKSSHFHDHMKAIQGKENHDIPQNVIDKITMEINKLRVTETKELTYTYMRTILKKLNEPKYYRSIPRIIYIISGMKPLQLTPALEDKLHKCFLQIVDSFEHNHKGTRKSLISYPYILSKLFQMFGLHEYRKFFPTLRPCKLREHDEIYSKIVKDIAQKDSDTPWSFTPSM